MYNTTLNETWETKSDHLYNQGMVNNRLDYCIGAEDFQEQAIKSLEELIDLESLNTNPVMVLGLRKAVELLKNLDAEIILEEPEFKIGDSFYFHKEPEYHYTITEGVSDDEIIVEWEDGSNKKYGTYRIATANKLFKKGVWILIEKP